MKKKKAKKTESKEQPVKSSVNIDTGINMLLEYLGNRAAKTSAFSACRISSESETRKYVDFYDPKYNRPCLPLEWLFGTRGLISGRVLNIVGDSHAGKSSFVMLLFAMGMSAGGCYPIYIETEEAPLAPYRIADLGINPDLISEILPAGITECFEEIEQTIYAIRTKMDPEQNNPIIIGLDSVSGLGNIGIDRNTGKQLSGSGSAGLHARQFSDFFRNKLKVFKANNAVFVTTSQIKTSIPMAGSFGGAAKETHIAEGTIKYHSSWKLKIKKMKELETIKSGEPRNLVVMVMEKNKLAGAAMDRRIMAHLYETERAWDFNKATVDIFNGNYSPFKMDEYKSGGGWYSHKALNGGKSMHLEEFVNAFYEHDDLLMQCREVLQIQGFGFDFEKNKNKEALDVHSGPKKTFG